MPCNSYSNRFCDFYIFPIVGIGAINFQNTKTGNPPLFSRVFSLWKKWNKFFSSIFINYTMWLTLLCWICVSIVQGFPSKAFLKQRLAHPSASAKTIPAFWHQTLATNIPWTGGQVNNLHQYFQWRNFSKNHLYISSFWQCYFMWNILFSVVCFQCHIFPYTGEWNFPLSELDAGLPEMQLRRKLKTLPVCETTHSFAWHSFRLQLLYFLFELSKHRILRLHLIDLQSHRMSL